MMSNKGRSGPPFSENEHFVLVCKLWRRSLIGIFGNRHARPPGATMKWGLIETDLCLILPPCRSLMCADQKLLPCCPTYDPLDPQVWRCGVGSHQEAAHSLVQWRFHAGERHDNRFSLHPLPSTTPSRTAKERCCLENASHSAQSARAARASRHVPCFSTDMRHRPLCRPETSGRTTQNIKGPPRAGLGVLASSHDPHPIRLCLCHNEVPSLLSRSCDRAEQRPSKPRCCCPRFPGKACHRHRHRPSRPMPRSASALRFRNALRSSGHQQPASIV